jgi:hypothetical protein
MFSNSTLPDTPLRRPLALLFCTSCKSPSDRLLLIAMPMLDERVGGSASTDRLLRLLGERTIAELPGTPPRRIPAAAPPRTLAGAALFGDALAFSRGMLLTRVISERGGVEPPSRYW